MTSEPTPKRRLLIATDNFLPRWDGIARFLSEIIPRLQEEYDITVVAPDFGVYEDPTITLVKIPLSRIWKVGDFRPAKFKRGLIRDLVHRSDIIFTQTIGPIGSLAIKESKRQRRPVAAFIHSIEWELVPKAMRTPLLRKYIQVLTKRIARSLYNKCTLLIVPSSSTEELFHWNAIHTKSRIVHLGVDTVKFIPLTPERRMELRSQLGFLETDIVIGYHGRISREKDLITLLRAFSRIQIKYPNSKLLIVGDGLESIKKQFMNRHQVILVGSKNNPVPYLQAMDIYCLTSLTETTCLSMLEAMSCALPAITTEVGFVRNYVRNGINGLFFPKQNPYYLARQIERLIADPLLRFKIGENARRSIVEQFSWDKTAEGIKDALDEIGKR